MPSPSLESPKPRSWRFRIGLLFLLINVPFGLIGLAAGTALYAKTHQIFWEGAGVCCYALSWAMLGLGIWMAGPEGKRLAKEIGRRIISPFKRKK